MTLLTTEDYEQIETAIKNILNEHRCKNPIKKPLPNPEGYASKVECTPCGQCSYCKLVKAFEILEGGVSE